MRAIQKNIFKCIIIVGICYLPVVAFAQERKEREPTGLNNWYIELGGAGLFYSLNYEKVLYKSTLWGWVGRVGIGYNPSQYTLLNKITLNDNTFMVPFTTSALYGSRKEKLEFGGGFTLLSEGLDNREVAFTGVLGFRVVETNKVCFRVAYTPIIRSGEYIHWFGVSLGMNFSLK